ncbi:MAG: hypothetical protein D6776_04950 [Planctomycetota bacterium]|nr:MAG: hypothetical protein D6776_04950 [Planctomycetota bacterium]
MRSSRRIIAITITAAALSLLGHLPRAHAAPAEPSAPPAAGAERRATDAPAGLWGGFRPGRSRETSAPEPPPVETGALLRSSITLSLLVLALGGAAALVLRLTVGRRRAANVSAGGLRSLGSLRLGGKDAVHVVRVGQRLLVIGTGGGAPRLLDRIEGEGADRLETEVAGTGFAAWLRAVRPDASAAGLPRRGAAPRRRSEHGSPQPRAPHRISETPR